MTTRESVRVLVKSILTRLENEGAIEFAAEKRQEIQEEAAKLVDQDILTEEDLKKQVYERLGAKHDEVVATHLDDDDQYRAAKKIVRQEFGDDELNGFYFQVPLREVAQKISSYLMDSPLIEDVFEQDEELNRLTIDTVKRFKLSDLH